MVLVSIQQVLAATRRIQVLDGVVAQIALDPGGAACFDDDLDVADVRSGYPRSLPPGLASRRRCVSGSRASAWC